MPHYLNLRLIESRMGQLVIDLHDLARYGEAEDVGTAVALRGVAHDLSRLITRVRRLLPSSIDSSFTDFTD